MLGMFAISIWWWSGVVIVFVLANSHLIITHVYVRKSQKAVKTSWCHATFSFVPMLCVSKISSKARVAIIQKTQALPTGYCYFLHNKVQMVGRITVFQYNQWYHEYILDSQLTYPYSMLKKGGYWKLLCNEASRRCDCWYVTIDLRIYVAYHKMNPHVGKKEW